MDIAAGVFALVVLLLCLGFKILKGRNTTNEDMVGMLQYDADTGRRKEESPPEMAVPAVVLNKPQYGGNTGMRQEPVEDV